MRRNRWHIWRRTRPLTASLLATAGGTTIMMLPADQYTVLTLPGVAGLAGFLLGGFIAAAGLIVMFRPQDHALLGIAIVLSALASFIYSNLGGFLIGMLLSLIGGCLAYAWTSTQA